MNLLKAGFPSTTSSTRSCPFLPPLLLDYLKQQRLQLAQRRRWLECMIPCKKEEASEENEFSEENEHAIQSSQFELINAVIENILQSSTDMHCT